VSTTWRQVQPRQHLLDQLAAELALHERVGGDQADEAGRPIAASDSQFEEALGERRAERILHVAAGVVLR
jgi:hypothetical protein